MTFIAGFLKSQLDQPRISADTEIPEMQWGLMALGDGKL